MNLLSLISSWLNINYQITTKVLQYQAQNFLQTKQDHILLGDGKATLFWWDRWLNGDTIKVLAPDLFHAKSDHITIVPKVLWEQRNILGFK